MAESVPAPDGLKAELERLRSELRVANAGNAFGQAATAERNALRAQLAELEQVVELARTQTEDCVQQVDQVLGHRYHTPGVHYSIPHIAEKAAAEIAELTRERDLAVAHDRQPYPTAWAYEQVCRTDREKQARIDAALAECDREYPLGRVPIDELPSAAQICGRIRAALEGDQPSLPLPPRGEEAVTHEFVFEMTRPHENEGLVSCSCGWAPEAWDVEITETDAEIRFAAHLPAVASPEETQP